MIFAIVGTALTLFYFFFPMFFSMARKKNGFVFAPINNQDKLCGDDRIYASCVQEVRNNFFVHRHPCADSNEFLLDYTRGNAYRLTALLGFFLRDNRWAILLSYLLVLGLEYNLIFYCVYLFTGYTVVSMIAAFVLLVYNRLFSEFTFSKDGVKKILYVILGVIWNRDRTAFPNAISDNFRYVICSTSNLLIWVTFLLLYLMPTMHGSWIMVTLFIYFVCGAFVYPPTTMAAFVVIFIGIIYQHNQNLTLSLFISGGLAVACILCLGGYAKIKLMKTLNNQVLNESHVVSNDESRSFVRFLITMPLLPLILIVFVLNVFFSIHYLFYIIPLYFFCINIGGFLFKKQKLVARFTGRGMAEFLSFSLVVELIWVSSLVLPSQTFLIVSVVLGAVLFASAIVGMLRMAKQLDNTSAYRMPQDEWEVYRFFNQNIQPRRSVFTFSLSPYQLLPVYTHANLYVTGAEWLGEPGAELQKFSDSVKSFHKNKNWLFEQFEQYFSSRQMFSCNPVYKVPGANFDGFHLINTLIYIPFVQSINGIKIYNAGFSAWTDEFKEYLTQLKSKFVHTTPTDHIEYIVACNNFDKDAIADKYRKIFENGSYSIFEKIGIKQN